MYLCICKSVSDRQIRQAVEQGARSFGDLSARFGVGLDCGKCTESINVWLQDCLSAAPSQPVRAETAPAPLTTPPTPTPDVKKPAPAPAHAWFAIDA